VEKEVEVKVEEARVGAREVVMEVVGHVGAGLVAEAVETVVEATGMGEAERDPAEMVEAASMVVAVKDKGNGRCRRGFVPLAAH
jgi:hypothetical protein